MKDFYKNMKLGDKGNIKTDVHTEIYLPKDKTEKKERDSKK